MLEEKSIISVRPCEEWNVRKLWCRWLIGRGRQVDGRRHTEDDNVPGQRGHHGHSDLLLMEDVGVSDGVCLSDLALY